jgi:ribosomal-protein-serine acetyltransferase
MINPIALDNETLLISRRPEHTAGIFAAVERSREHLRAWLDWVDACKSVDDIDARQKHAQELHERGELVEFVIVRHGTIIGKVDLHAISPSDGSARIGYWLSAEAEGHGSVTEAVKRVNRFGFETIGLNRIEIWTAADNLRSRAVATRAGYVPKTTPAGESEPGEGTGTDAKFVMTRERWLGQ